MAYCKDYSNTGGNLCAYLSNVASRLLLFPELGSDGTKNEIATEAGVTKAALQALIIEAETKDRLYPLPKMEQVEEVRNENETFEYESGNVVKMRDGSYQFKGLIPFGDGGPDLLKRLESWYGQDFGCFIIDIDGNFRYEIDSTNILVQPFMIDGDSWSVRMIYAKYKEPLFIEVMFNFKSEVNDGDQVYIAKSSLDFDGRSNTDLYALRDVVITEVAESLTTLTVLVKTDKNIPVTARDETDWLLYNDTTTTAITVVSAVESATIPGQYVLTFIAQTNADAYTLNMLAASKFDPADTLTGILTT